MRRRHGWLIVLSGVLMTACASVPERSVPDWRNIPHADGDDCEQDDANVHDFTMIIPRGEHLRLHNPGGRGGPWNQAWRDFARRNPNASPQQIQDQLTKMIVDFNIMGPIVPYYYMR